MNDMKKIITIICSVLISLSIVSVVFADEDPKITISKASGNETTTTVSGSVDQDIAAVVIEVVDENGQILSMQTEAVKNKSFSASIYAKLEVGEKYKVKVANFDGGKWANEEFTAVETSKPSSGGNNDSGTSTVEEETKTPIINYLVEKKIEVTPKIEEFKAEEHANVSEPTVLVSDSNAIVNTVKNIVSDLSVLTKDSKLPDYISETDAGAIYKALAAGKELSIEVEANIITSEDIKQDAEKIEAYVDEIAKDVNGTVQLYLDLNVNLLADNEKIANINQLNSEMEFAIALDESTLSNFENKFIYIVCLHDGETTYTEATLNGNILYFKADKFSTYGVITTDSKLVIENPIEEVVEDIIVEEKSNIGLYIGIGVAVVAAAGIVVILARRKRA